MERKSFREIFGNSGTVLVEDYTQPRRLTPEQKERLDKMVQIFRETFPRMKDFVPVPKTDTREQWQKDWEAIWNKPAMAIPHNIEGYMFKPGAYEVIMAARGNGKSLLMEKKLDDYMDALAYGLRISTVKPPPTVTVIESAVPRNAMVSDFPIMSARFKGFEPGVLQTSFAMTHARQMGKDVMGIRDILDKMEGK